MRPFASALGSVALVTLLSAPAFADCPGSAFCTELGEVTFGIPGPSVVVQAPTPATVPAPVYVYAQPAPPPVYVYAPPPQPVTGARLGIDLRGDGAGAFGASRLGRAYGLGGAGLGLRYRATPHFGVELGADVLGGRDYDGDKRLEIAGSLGALLFLSSRSRVQPYLSAGVLADHATATDDHSAVLAGASFASPPDRSFTHVGGYGGIGLEVFATRNLAAHLDVRGVVREAVSSSDGRPELTAADGRTTNTSGGVVASGGVIFYL